MSPPKDSDRPAEAAPERQANPATNGQGILSQLPRTRPQRTSPRRDAARAASAAAETAETAAVAKAAAVMTAASAAPVAPARSNGRPPARAKSATPRTTGKPASERGSSAGRRATGGGARAAKKATAPVLEPAPRQGFECETERANGTVNPPGGADLVASAAEIVGELAKAGVSTGERLLKDFLSRLPLS